MRCSPSGSCSGNILQPVRSTAVNAVPPQPYPVFESAVTQEPPVRFDAQCLYGLQPDPFGTDEGHRLFQHHGIGTFILRVADSDLKTFETRFDSMARHVRKIGIDTKYTAVEIAGAVKYLSMAGMNIETINKSIRPIRTWHLSVTTTCRISPTWPRTSWPVMISITTAWTAWRTLSPPPFPARM